MKRTVIALLTLSISLGAGKLPTQIEHLKKALQNKYQVYSLEDISKLKKQPTAQHERTASRDMEDLVGDWSMEEENEEFFITVGTAQSIPDFMTLVAMAEAEGSVTATASDYVTELTYLFDPFFMEGDDGGDCDINCEGEYDDYNDYDIEPSDIYCECCHEDYPIDEICEDEDSSGYYYGPRIGAYLTDLDPGAGGAVYFDDTATEATVTFVDVPLFDDSDAVQTFQIQLIYGTNEIILSYKNLSLTGSNTANASGGLAIGIADGSGDYVEVDFSTASEETYTYPVEGYTEYNQLDMEYIKVTFTPSNDFTEYTVSHESITDLPGSYSNMIYVEDDSYEYQALSQAFLFYGGDYNQIYINNDGNIGFEGGDEHCVCWFCDEGDGICAAEYLAGRANDEDDDDDGPDVLIMNMDLMEFFMASFGMDLDSLDIENPTVLAFGSSSDDDNIDMVMGMMFVETGVIELLMADSAEAVAATSIDTLDWSITFANLSLYDSTGTAVLTVTGTIGPGWIDFIAGEETSISFFNEDGESDMEFYLSLYDDSTGMDIQVFYPDTSYFDWSATTDSLFLYFEGDYYYEEEADTMGLEYMINEDTLFTSGSFYPCEEEGYDSYEDCFDDMDIFPGLDELEDVEDFHIHLERVFTAADMTAIEPTNGKLPDEFKLYAAYPNPFNPVTTIRFDVGEANHESILRIYDISGRNVATLVNDQLQSGTYEVKWDARGFASGIYFTELISGTKRHTQKMVLLK